MTEPRFAHALVIGGTGMLRQAASWLAERATTTTMIARDAHRLACFREAHPAGCVHTASLDYHDDDLLRSAIAEATHRSGPIDMALAWIHGTASRAPRTVAQHCGTKNIVTKGNGLSLSDKERMDAIDQIYNKMLEYRNLTKYYTRKSISVSYIRTKEKNDMKRVLALYGSPSERYW